MIEEVKQKERITANRTNEIIRVCNNLNPSDSFMNTPSGPVLMPDIPNGELKNDRFIPSFFQLKWKPSFQVSAMTDNEIGYDVNQPVYGFYVNLGQDVNVLKEALGTEKFCLYGSLGLVELSASTQLSAYSDKEKFCNSSIAGTSDMKFRFSRIEVKPGPIVGVFHSGEPEGIVDVVNRQYGEEEGPDKTEAELKDTKLIGYLKDKRLYMACQISDYPDDIGTKVDSQISALKQESIQWRTKTFEDDPELSGDSNLSSQTFLQLFEFDVLSAKTEPILSAQDVLVREPGEDNTVTLKYLPLSSVGGEGTAVDVDAQYMASKFPHRYSIDWMPDADNDDKVLQMYRFDQSPTNSQYKLRFDDDGQIPQNTISADFIVREYSADAGGVNLEVNYQDGKEVVVPHEVTDGERYAQTGNGHVSINYAHGQQGEPKFLQLNNFSSYSTTSDANGLSANGDGILIRKKSSGDNHLELQYLNVTGLRKLVSMPSLSALNGLSVVTGIEYPMTGTNQYKIVAHRKQLHVVNNELTITNLADQTIDTVAHDSIYPNN